MRKNFELAISPKVPVQWTVGYWLNEKKSRKFSIVDFSLICRSLGMDLVQLDLNRPLNEQGNFGAILHKLTDIVAQADAGDSWANSVVESFQKYVDDHPNVVIIDRIGSIHDFLDRTKTYSILKESELGKEDIVFTPSFVELQTVDVEENKTRLKSANVTFPFVCKNTLAHGSYLAHQMALIFDENGLTDVNPPCVAQSFINHNAVLHKVFVIGNKWHIVRRPSIKNFYSGSIHTTIFFDSHCVSKADSSSVLNQLDEDDEALGVAEAVTDLDWAVVDRIVSTIRDQMCINLFGVDIVIENGTGRYAIIDINVFPGYDGYPDVLTEIAKFIRDQIVKASATFPGLATTESATGKLFCKGSVTSLSGFMDPSSLDDSGVDTGDSSADEKKHKQAINSSARGGKKLSHNRGVPIFKLPLSHIT